jgi:superfamily II DNA or RNA helicase
MACGTGKTLTALFIREKLAAQRTLVLMPSLQLMKQTIGEWTRNKTVDFDFLPVCSDETVSKDDDDMPVSSASDLGLPVTTDPDEIAAFLRRRSGPLVVFATYQSSPEIAKAFKLSRVPAFDLAIADEAHRCAASHSSEFATILSNEMIKTRRRLFMTATPRIYSAHVLRTQKEAGYEFASMDDEEKFGKVFHRLTFREAIQRNLLTDYQVAIIGVDNATYRDWAEKAWFITIDSKVVKDARSVAGQIGLAKAMRRYDLHRVITFHRLVKGAREFKVSFPDVIDWVPARQRPKGKLWTDYVDGTMSAEERQRRLQCLRDVDDGEHAVISNARCLTEGIDVPTLDGVAFIDPKRSEIDIAQAVGRAIRLADGKTIGTIVIPVFVDTDEPNPDVILDDSAFKPVWDVLLALRAHDEDLAQQLDDLRRMLGRLRGGSRGPLRLPPKVHVVDIPDVCGVEFARAFHLRIIEQTTASWEFWYGLLEYYAEREGHTRVLLDHVEDGFRLGQWVGVQRTSYGKGTLGADRIRRLEELPGWTWDPHTDQWEEGFGCLLRYAEREGHTRVPKEQVEDGFRLGQWVNWLRTSYGKGKLGADRIRRLEELPGWTWTPTADRWEEGFGYLLRYAERVGHTRVPANHVEDGYRLGKWVTWQRNKYGKGTLSADRISRLEELPGWTWETRAAWWEEGFGCLVSYAEREGHTRVPAKHVEDGYRLGQWVNVQRTSYGKGTLSTDRISRLEELPGWTWDPHTDQWEEGFGCLLRYAEREGHTRVPAKHVEDGYPLGRWVNWLRTLYGKGKLDPDRIRRLEELPGWTWTPKADRWEEGFGYLMRYAEREGHTRVPDGHVEDGYRLGGWVLKQRTRCRDPERQRRLEELPGWTWNAYADQWEEAFGYLLRYAEREGHTRVPANHVEDGYRLGTWVSTQRASYRRGTLDPDRIRQLEELPGWTWKARESS